MTPSSNETLERIARRIPIPEPAYERMLRRRDRKRRNQRIAAGVVGMAVFVAAVWIVTAAGSFDRTTTPADKPTEKPAGKTAEEVARDFLYETAFFDTGLAVRHLVNDAAVSGLGLDGIGEFRRWLSFNEATGFQVIPTSCEETGSSGLGTYVRCTFDFHGIRSEAIGRGPYSGSYFDILVADHIAEYGKILDVSARLDIAKFGPQMWDPFAEWVSATYPVDAAVMYNDSLTDYRLTPRSIRLWKQHTREYVETGPVAETGLAETGPTAAGAVPKTDFLLDLDTGKMTQLPESIVGTEDNTAGYEVSPDGSEVAYYGRAEDGSEQVFVANLDGTHVRQITSNGLGTLIYSAPGWSPDGTKIAYVGHRTGEVTGRGFVIDLASGVTTQVTSDTEEVGGIQFSPDGSSILYTTWVPSTSGPPFVDHRVRIVPLTGGEASTLVSGDRTWDGWGGPTEARLSPDGSLLSYLCGNSSDDVLDLCVANADGSGARVLASGEIMSASWSPDGTRIAYWVFHKVEVFVVNVATGMASYVTEGAHPVWLDNHTLLVEHDRCSGPAGSNGCGG
jgi:Tol biopolymer transport system component